MGWQRYVSIALLLVIALSMRIPLSLGESSRICTNPSGVVNVSSAHVELDVEETIEFYLKTLSR